MKIIFATHNKNELKQIQKLLPEFDIIGLADVGMKQDLPKNENGFRQNAESKARFVFGKTKLPCLADDGGLCIDVLEGWPGVQTRSFLGEQATAQERNEHILTKMKGISDRACSVICSLCFVDTNGKAHFCEGVFDTQIAQQAKGDNKFDFDEIIIWKDDKTLAEATDKQKMDCDARVLAVKKMQPMLQEIEMQYKRELVRALLKRI